MLKITYFVKNMKMTIDYLISVETLSLLLLNRLLVWYALIFFEVFKANESTCVSVSSGRLQVSRMLIHSVSWSNISSSRVLSAYGDVRVWRLQVFHVQRVERRLVWQNFHDISYNLQCYLSQLLTVLSRVREKRFKWCRMKRFDWKMSQKILYIR